jgi:hypothetical protein
MSETNRDDDGSTDPVGSAGPTDVSESFGWQPHFPPGPQRAISDGLTVGMTDAEILAHYRQFRPYINLTRAKASYRGWLRMRHVVAAFEKAREQERQEAERRLRDIVKRKK